MAYLCLAVLQLCVVAPPSVWEWLHCFWRSSCVHWWACLTFAPWSPPAGYSSGPERLHSNDLLSPSPPSLCRPGLGYRATRGASNWKRTREISVLLTAGAPAIAASPWRSHNPLEPLCSWAAATAVSPVMRRAGWWPSVSPAAWDTGALRRLTGQRSFSVKKGDERGRKAPGEKRRSAVTVHLSAPACQPLLYPTSADSDCGISGGYCYSCWPLHQSGLHAVVGWRPAGCVLKRQDWKTRSLRPGSPWDRWWCCSQTPGYRSPCPARLQTPACCSGRV